VANTNERWRTKRSAQEAALLDEILLDEIPPPEEH
jgi:hypothetical protein